VRVFDDVAAYYIATDRPGRALEVQDLGRAQALIDLQDQLEVAGPIALCGMQEMLERAPHEAVLLSLSWESDSLVALLLTSTSKEPRVYRTGVTRNNVDALLDIYHREVLLYRGEGIMSWMQRAMPLLAAAADDIPENGVVFLVLEEELQALPIHAIPLADGKRLLDRAAVVYAPNIQLLAQWARVREVQFKPGQEFVCAGVAFQDEALALVQRFGSMGFTGNQLNKNDLAEYFKYARFIHVACHGYFDPENHLESGLVLTNTDEVLARDVLSVRELLDWKFQADLVVLSACETGRGIASASDFLGLSRAFHAAGAHAVMTALWDVENMATQRLMLDFYDRLFSQRVQGHLDAAEALRQAQLNAAKSTSFCDWAAFKLTGWPFFASIQGD
jgi:CHAT domain-containing protein